MSDDSNRRSDIETAQRLPKSTHRSHQQTEGGTEDLRLRRQGILTKPSPKTICRPHFQIVGKRDPHLHWSFAKAAQLSPENTYRLHQKTKKVVSDPHIHGSSTTNPSPKITCRPHLQINGERDLQQHWLIIEIVHLSSKITYRPHQQANGGVGGTHQYRHSAESTTTDLQPQKKTTTDRISKEIHTRKTEPGEAYAGRVCTEPQPSKERDREQELGEAHATTREAYES